MGARVWLLLVEEIEINGWIHSTAINLQLASHFLEINSLISIWSQILSLGWNSQNAQPMEHFGIRCHEAVAVSQLGR